MTPDEATRRARAEREAWEAEHLHGPNADYIEIDERHVVKALAYDPQVHGPALISADEIARRVVNAKVLAGELERLPSGSVREVQR